MYKSTILGNGSKISGGLRLNFVEAMLAFLF